MSKRNTPVRLGAAQQAQLYLLLKEIVPENYNLRGLHTHCERELDTEISQSSVATMCKSLGIYGRLQPTPRSSKTTDSKRIDSLETEVAELRAMLEDFMNPALPDTKQ